LITAVRVAGVGKMVGEEVQIPMAKLTAREMQRRKIPGSSGDGGGLYLQISGPSRTDAASLVKPREKAIEARPLLVAGTDPIEARRETGVVRIAPCRG
jgi:hypothetical protein